MGVVTVVSLINNLIKCYELKKQRKIEESNSKVFNKDLYSPYFSFVIYLICIKLNCPMSNYEIRKLNNKNFLIYKKTPNLYWALFILNYCKNYFPDERRRKTFVFRLLLGVFLIGGHLDSNAFFNFEKMCE